MLSIPFPPDMEAVREQPKIFVFITTAIKDEEAKRFSELEKPDWLVIQDKVVVRDKDRSQNTMFVIASKPDSCKPYYVARNFDIPGLCLVSILCNPTILSFSVSVTKFQLKIVWRSSATAKFQIFKLTTSQ